MGWKSRHDVRPGTARWDKFLESRGLLKYQVQGLSSSEVQDRYARRGLTPDWQSLGMQPDQGAGISPSSDNWGQPSQPSPSAGASLSSPQLPAVTAPPAMPTPQAIQLDKNTTAFTGLGYQPGYWQDPKNVARWFNESQANPSIQLPEGMDKGTLDGLYNYMRVRNGSRPPEHWAWLNAADPMTAMLGQIQTPSSQFLLPSEQQRWGVAPAAPQATPAVLDYRRPDFDWTKLSLEQRQAVLADPNFHVSQVVAPGQQGLILSDSLFDWSKTQPFFGIIPQQVIFNALQNPTTAPLAQAVVMGGMATAGGGPVPGALAAGGALALGYGHNIPDGWLGSPAKWLVEGVGKVLMFGAQSTEQLAAQVPAIIQAGSEKLKDPAHAAEIDAKYGIDPQLERDAWGNTPWARGMLASMSNYFSPGSADVSKLTPDELQGYASWEAGKTFYETRPAAFEVGKAVMNGLHSIGIATDKQAQNAVFYLGENAPVQVQPGYSVDDARQRILKGESAESVLADFQRVYGVSGTISDFTLQAAFDPLTALPEVAGETRARLGELKLSSMEKAFRAEGAMTAEQAARLSVQQAHINASRLKPSIFGELLPNSETSKAFRDLVRSNPDQLTTQQLASALSSRERILAGLTPDGKIAELLPVTAKPTVWNLWNSLKLQPKSQAIVSGHIVFENVGTLLNMAEDGHVTAQTRDILASYANGDMQAVRAAGAQFLDNPEMYTSIGAIRDFMPTVESRASAYDAAARQRDAILHMAETLHEDPHQIAKRYTDGEPRSDFELWQKTAGEAGLKDVADALGLRPEEVTPDTLAKAFEVFKQGRVEITPQEYKANLLGDLEAHMRDWGKQYFQVNPKDTGLASALKLMKNVQSLALLDFSPSYYLNNMINENILLMAGGSFNFEGHAKLDAWMEKFGVRPATWGEGNTPAGFEHAATPHASDRGLLQKMADASGDLRKKIGLFNNLTGSMNEVHSKRAYVSAMKQFYGQMWRAGSGFELMTPQLEERLRAGGIDPKLVYRAIEGQFNPNDLAGILGKGVNDHSAELYLQGAAEKLGLDPARAIDMLGQIGVLDELRSRLAEAKTPQERARVFDQVHRIAQDHVDVREALEIRNRAEHFANTVKAEGLAGAHNVLMDVQGSLEKRWLDHYAAAGELQADLANVQDFQVRSALYHNWRVEQQGAWRRYYGYEASAWQGLLDGLGVKDHGKKEFMSLLADYMDTNQVLTKQQMEAYDAHFAKEYPSFDDAMAAFKQLETRFDKAWQNAETVKAGLWQKLDNLTVMMYLEAFGPEVGANARRWVDDKAAFHQQMVDARQRFRASTEGMSKGEKIAAKWKFYQEEYPRMISEFTAKNMGNENNLYKPLGGAETAPAGPAGRPPLITPAEQVGPPSPGAQALDRINADLGYTQQGAKSEPDVNALLSFAEQENARARTQLEDRLGKIWEAAGQSFDRNNAQDHYALLNALRKPELGGIPDLTSLHDPRLTPDRVRSILELQPRTSQQRAVDLALWEAEFTRSSQDGDLNRMLDLIDQFPPELANEPLANGMTYNELIGRMWGDSASKVDVVERTDRIANQVAQSTNAMIDSEMRGQAVLTRQGLRDKFSTQWGPEQADRYMEISDAVAQWYERVTGGNADEFYSRYYKDVVAGGGEGGLFQPPQSPPILRKMTPEEVDNYARALVRAGFDELRRAVTYEDTTAERIALLNAAHHLNPNLAEQVARRLTDLLFQDGEFRQPKGAVTFDDTGIRGTIHALEARDFSTLVHENAHIYRRVLADVVARTGNERMRADLAALEQWAGVKDGQWGTAHEEKFARAFERYIAEGWSPNVKLVSAFESFRTWMLQTYRTITGSQIDVKMNWAVRRVFNEMLGTEQPPAAKPRVEPHLEQVAIPQLSQSVPSPTDVRPLFHDGGQVPVLPGGGYDQLSGYAPMSKLLEDGWFDKVKPLLEGMKDSSQRPENRYVFNGLDDGTQQELNGYLNDVRGQMASVKHATVRYGETQRDYAMLNYDRQYNVDKLLSAGIPYEFFATRSALNWIPRMLDHPAWGSNLARLYKLHNTYQSQLPERLRNKYFIPVPFLPKWMGGGVYVDPVNQAFPFMQFIQPLQAYSSDQAQLNNSATYVLRNWGQDGTLTPQQADTAMQAMSGPDWERALQEARQQQGENQSTGADYFSMIFSPALYASIPYYLATGKKMTNMGWPSGQLPITRFGSGMETAFKGTSLEWIGNAAGLLAKPEQFARQQLKLGEFGEWTDFYVDRQITDGVAEGHWTAQDAEMAMIERKGPIYDAAMGRVRQELMLKVPGMAPLYGLANGATLDKVIGAMVPSLFPGGILPPGEMEMHGLKQEYNLAWDKYKAGDTKAISAFFDAHPEYQARLALRRDPKERLQQFLRSSIWDAYNELGKTNRKQVTAVLGPDFQDFLSSDPGVEFSVDQLVTWSRMLNRAVPQTPETQPLLQQQVAPAPIYGPEVTQLTDQFFSQRSQRFPNFYTQEQMYYSLAPSDRAAYLARYPELRAYRSWRDSWYTAHPELKSILNSQAFASVDTRQWPPELENLVRMSALTGDRLPSGAQAMLQQLWVQQGRPRDNYQSWLTGVVYPAMKNQMMWGAQQP